MHIHNKRANKQHDGFSLVEVLFIMVIVVLVGLAGWFVYKKHAIATASTKWVRYNSTYANFSVDFPRKPAIVEPFGEKGTCLDQSFANELTQYSVQCAVYDSDAKISNLDDFRQGQEGEFQHIASDSHKYIKISGYSAETFEMTGTGNNYKLDMAGESLLSGKYIYNLFTIRSGSSIEQAPYTKYFFNSFRIE
jgi:hypothetical protein